MDLINPLLAVFRQRKQSGIPPLVTRLAETAPEKNSVLPAGRTEICTRETRGISSTAPAPASRRGQPVSPLQRPRGVGEHGRPGPGPCAPALGGRGRLRPRRNPQGALPRARRLRHRRGRGGSERGERPARQGAPARPPPPFVPSPRRRRWSRRAPWLHFTWGSPCRRDSAPALPPAAERDAARAKGAPRRRQAGRQVGAGGAPEGKLGSGRQRGGRAGLLPPRPSAAVAARGFTRALRPLVTGAERAHVARAPRSPPSSRPPSAPPLRPGHPAAVSAWPWAPPRGGEPVPSAGLRAHREWRLFPPAPVAGSSPAAAGSGATSGRNPSGDAGLPRLSRGDAVCLKSRESPTARAVVSFSRRTKVAAGEQVRYL